jgi:23S rRNA-/tRNA-specific pseudouridylate synthase
MAGTLSAIPPFERMQLHADKISFIPPASQKHCGMVNPTEVFSSENCTT